jgi:hypothetical protein
MERMPMTGSKRLIGGEDVDVVDVVVSEVATEDTAGVNVVVSEAETVVVVAGEVAIVVNVVDEADEANMVNVVNVVNVATVESAVTGEAAGRMVSGAAETVSIAGVGAGVDVVRLFLPSSML